SVGTTGFAVWAFENHGHFDKNDHNEDIYADAIAKGIDYILCNSATTFAVPPQGTMAYNPDADGNGIVLDLAPRFATDGYASPIATAALISALDNGKPITCGPEAGQMLKQAIQDACDFVGYAQVDDTTGSPWRGGWRYSENSPSADTSIDSWNYV